jgi:hypothetical protein
MSKKKTKMSEKTVDEYYGQSRESSDKVSGIIRQLNFGGMAGIWLFCKAGPPLIIPGWANYTSLIFAFSFLSEIIQYLIQVEGCRRKGRSLELSGKTSGAHSPVWVTWSYRFFYAKIVLCLCGWVFFLFQLWFSR